MRITELNDVHCPYCYTKVVRAKHAGNLEPFKGCQAFCKICGSVSIFTDRTSKRRGLALRKPRWEEVTTIDNSTEMQDIKRRWLN